MNSLPLVILALLISSPVLANKVALVVGGATTSGEKTKDNETPRNHEFGRATARTTEGLKAKGYNVTTLFDNVGIPVGPISDEDKMLSMGSAFIREEMKRDYDKLGSLNASAATEANIINSLRQTMTSLGPGDEFEFILSAHGLRFCNGKETPEESTLDGNANNDPNCKHVIVLNDPTTGKPTYVDTKNISDVIREMDEKGIRTNLTMTSCHSGQAQELFRGLKNTCVILAASGNNWGMSCMPDDKPSDPGFMSSTDAVTTSLWEGVATQLVQQEDNYYKDDPCTQKLLNHYRKGIGGDNRYDLYMSARAKDGSPTEPSISSQFQQEYFRKGRFSALLINGLYGRSNLLCEQQTLDTVLEDLISLGEAVISDVDRRQMQQLYDRLKASMNLYDDNIRQQKAIIEQMNVSKEAIKDITPRFNDKMERIPQSPEDEAAFERGKNRLIALQSELRQLQDRALENAPEVISHERALVEFADQKFLRNQVPPEDPCLRQGNAS